MLGRSGAIGPHRSVLNRRCTGGPLPTSRLPAVRPESALPGVPVTRAASVVTPLRVTLAAEHALVGQAVSAALTGRGAQVRTAEHGFPRPRASSATGRRTEVGLYLYSGDLAPGLASVLDLLESRPLPWLVVAGDGPGALWGALFSTGAAAVLPSDASVDEVVEVLEGLAAGDRVADSATRRISVDRWRAVPVDRRDLLDRMRTLSPRELAVLRSLTEGLNARSIAAESSIAETTARTQVKAVLRKLGVGSRLGAVAAVHQLEGGPAGGTDR